MAGNVENLGQIGERRRNWLDGLPQALAEGLKIGTEAQHNRILAKIASQKDLTTQEIAALKAATTDANVSAKDVTAEDIAALKAQTSQGDTALRVAAQQSIASGRDTTDLQVANLKGTSAQDVAQTRAQGQLDNTAMRDQTQLKATGMRDTTAQDIANTRANASILNTNTNAGVKMATSDYDNQVKMLIQADKSKSAEEVASMADNTRMASSAMANPTAKGNNSNQQMIDDANEKNLNAIIAKKQSSDLNFQNAQKLHEQFTMKHEYMNDDQKANFEAQGHHDEIKKAIAQGYGISAKDIPSLNPVNIYKKQVQSTIAKIPAMVKSGQPLDPQTKGIYQLVKKYGVDDVALASHMAAKDSNIDHKNAQATHAAIDQKAQIIQSARQGQDNSQQQDPLGILQ